MSEHQHVWSAWGRWVEHYDSLGLTAISWSYATLQGGTPITPGWARVCRSCGAAESR